MSNQAQAQIDNLQKALNITQRLRSNVTQVFQKLSDGFEDVENNEKALLNDLQKSLGSVNTGLSDLESGSTSLGPITSAGNSALICVDPTIDKTSTYSQLLQSYKLTDKMREQSAYAYALIRENSSKRTHVPSSILRTQRRRTQSPYLYPPSSVDHLIGSLIQQYRESMNISIVRPLGSSAVVQVVLGKTLKALLVFRGVVIEWVRVKGFMEEFQTEDGKVDIWSPSRYEVFRKVTNNVTAATLHYFLPDNPEISIKSLMIWLHSYSTLFSASCQACGHFLQNGLPPTWRCTRTKRAYHEQCRLIIQTK